MRVIAALCRGSTCDKARQLDLQAFYLHYGSFGGGKDSQIFLQQDFAANFAAFHEASMIGSCLVGALWWQSRNGQTRKRQL